MQIFGHNLNQTLQTVILINFLINKYFVYLLYKYLIINYLPIQNLENIEPNMS